MPYTGSIEKVSATTHEHFVQFYEQDDFLLDEVSGFIGAGLQVGQAGVVIATRQHLDGLKQRLKTDRGFTGAALDGDRYIALDAAATLPKFLIDGRPDEGRFADVIGPVIELAAQNGNRPVRAFGEMVALLWAEGKHDAAIHLEEMWNDLAKTHSFSLLCAYPMGGFRDEEHGSSFLHICKAHSHVRPAESFLGTTDPDELHRQVALLQQKAAALETEVVRRKQSEQALAEANRRKDEFLAMLGHELRNPLGAITTSLELMKLGSGDPALVTRSRGIAARQAAVMSRLVDDLLDVSRIARGKIQLRTEAVVLSDIVERAVEIARPLIDERGHRLTVDLPAEPVLLVADAARLVQVVANLLNNAAKYTNDRGNISLTAREDGTSLRLRICDDGIGLTADLCERIFEPFVQAQHTSERARGGLGIGLTLVRNLVELHGGSIEARSDGPGCGCELLVRLPLPGSKSVAELGEDVPAARQFPSAHPFPGRDL
jgi:signal transduction histidine kinase